MKQLPDQYGINQVVKIRDGYTFAVLLDELQKEYNENIANGIDQGFWKNRSWLYNAFKNELIYTIFLEDTSQTNPDDEIFCKNTFQIKFLIPTFCVVYPSFSETEFGLHVSMIWTAKRARRYGFASHLLNILNVHYVDHPLQSAQEFWKSQTQIKKSDSTDSRNWKTDNNQIID